MEKINVTKAARQFSEILNRVAYQGVSFELERGNRPIARLVPATPPGSMAVADLNDLFRRLPPLGEDAEVFINDVQSLRQALPKVKDPWRAS